MAKVSVIIPALENTNRIDELLNALLFQSEKDIEIICVASAKSESEKLLNNYALFDKRVKILQLKKNQAWLNVAVNMAVAPYVMILNPASMVAFAFVEYMLQLAALEKNVDFVYAPLSYKDELSCKYRNASKVSADNFIPKGGEGVFGATTITKEFLQNCDKKIEGKLIRTEFLRQLLRDLPKQYQNAFLFYQCLFKARQIAYTLHEVVYEWENIDPFVPLSYSTEDEKIKISVIIPVYNAQKHLSKCLDSLKYQTYNNIEIICVNDGSTDGSAAILQKYATKDSRFKIITQENKGVSAARNEALRHVTGDYVSMVDADDCVSLALYQKIVSIIQQTKQPIDMVQFNGLRFYDSGCVNPLLIYSLFKDSDWGDFYAGHIKDFATFYNLGDDLIWNKIYRTELLQKNNINFIEGVIFEDRAFALETHIKAKGIYFAENYMYFYRQHGSSLTHQLDENVFDLFKIFDHIENLLKREVDDYEKVKYLFLEFVIVESFIMLLSGKRKFQELFLQRVRARLNDLVMHLDVEYYRRHGGIYVNIYEDLMNLNLEQIREKYKNELFIPRSEDTENEA